MVRNVDLPRDVVKYMNQVGELILDSYAWRSLSPLWAVIKAAGRAPSIEEVVPPEKLEQVRTTIFILSLFMTPCFFPHNVCCITQAKFSSISSLSELSDQDIQ